MSVSRPFTALSVESASLFPSPTSLQMRQPEAELTRSLVSIDRGIPQGWPGDGLDSPAPPYHPRAATLVLC